ncbi:hypothetical protein [Chitinilyticum litopenaei]|uniref:hypothetical protein n=1 Tax=Chitinilyticum litopenaei TaxID=1121276 RepID=UPI0003FB5067|nr:hypothetical protein [Chitinilyticum litopenaei]
MLPELHRRASRWERGVWLASHALALLGCSVLPVWLAITASLGLLLHGWLCRPWRTGWRALAMTPDGVLVHAAGTAARTLSIQPDSRVLAGLIVLSLRDQRGSLRLVLWPDSAAPDLLRQWRVWLLWEWRARGAATPD